MDFKAAVETENPLFRRKEIEGTLHAEVAPSKVEVTKMLAEKYSVSEENIAVETIEGRFGAQEFIIVAQLYESKEAKEATETKTKRQRGAEAKAVEDAKKAEEETKTAAEKPVEAPVEEVKEEAAPAEGIKVEAPTEETKSK